MNRQQFRLSYTKLFKHIIHNWDDERARAILRNCHRVMGESARLLIIDRILSARPGLGDLVGYLVDMTMLYIALTPGGRERNKEQFQRLLESSGFKLTHVIETGVFPTLTKHDRTEILPLEQETASTR